MSDELPSNEQTPLAGQSSQSSPSSGFGVAARAFGRGLLRLLLILAILGIVGLVIYFAVPLAYRELVLPVRDTSAQLQAIQTQSASDKAGQNQTVQALQDRLNQLEIDRAAAASQQAGLQNGQESLRLTQSSLEGLLATLEPLRVAQESQGQFLSYEATQVNGLQATLNAPQAAVLGLQQQVEVLKALNLLTRAQLNLAANNYGQARENARAAREVLLALRDRLPEAERQALNPWLARLDLALAELPGSPVIAAGDLEIAYQLMASGILPPTPTPGALTPLPSPTPSPTPYQETPTPAWTPTPTATGTLPTPTATPFLSPTPTSAN